ncbi:MAG: shikimate kinase AroK [Pseudomonadales bacterium]
MSKPNIILVGLMAVGKSTVGRMLAQALGMEFFDSDHEIEARAGAPVAWIFDVEGEAGFREREQHVLDDLTGRQGVVIATGGGAVLSSCNRTMLAARGVVIHLDSPLERLVERTRRDRKRPLLRNGDPEATLMRLQRERDPLYREIADYRFVTDRQGPRVLAREIEERLRQDGVV